MSRKAFGILICFILLITSVFYIPIKTKSASIRVYVASHGTVYHADYTCRHLRGNNYSSISLGEARRRGLPPCSACTGNIYNPSASISTKKIYVGETAKIKLNYVTGNVVWSTSNSNISIVEKSNTKGKIKGIKKGSTTLTITGDGCIFKVKIKVMNVPATKLKLNKTKCNLVVKKSVKLKAKVSPKNTTIKTVTWKSSDEKVATVNNGVVTAKKEGTAKITAKCGNVKATCVIIVEKYSYSEQGFLVSAISVGDGKKYKQNESVMCTTTIHSKKTLDQVTLVFAKEGEEDKWIDFTKASDYRGKKDKYSFDIKLSDFSAGKWQLKNIVLQDEDGSMEVVRGFDTKYPKACFTVE